ncbi:MAG: type II toxin-antitoxin system VapC family toxin [Chloroflexi bacterium]|nr:type II toxin-antitoxin system VapC family toxin [Chloroflexota bacterium]
MKILIDTHTFLWFSNGSPQLSLYARNLIQDLNNSAFLSVGSLWEMAIKISQGKLSISHLPFDTFISQQISLNRFTVLDISIRHTAALIPLPFHHRDPFDRLLVAQALTEQIPLISRDTIFDTYGVTRLW